MASLDSYAGLVSDVSEIGVDGIRGRYLGIESGIKLLTGKRFHMSVVVFPAAPIPIEQEKVL